MHISECCCFLYLIKADSKSICLKTSAINKSSREVDRDRSQFMGQLLYPYKL